MPTVIEKLCYRIKLFYIYLLKSFTALTIQKVSISFKRNSLRNCNQVERCFFGKLRLLIQTFRKLVLQSVDEQGPHSSNSQQEILNIHRYYVYALQLCNILLKNGSTRSIRVYTVIDFVVIHLSSIVKLFRQKRYLTRLLSTLML